MNRTIQTVALAVALMGCGTDEPEFDPHELVNCGGDVPTCEAGCVFRTGADEFRGCTVATNPTEGEHECATTYVVDGQRGCCIYRFEFELKIDRWFVCEEQ